MHDFFKEYDNYVSTASTNIKNQTYMWENLHSAHDTIFSCPRSIIFEGGTSEGSGLRLTAGNDLLTYDHLKRSGADRRSSPTLWRGPGAAQERVAVAERENRFTFSAGGEMDGSILSHAEMSSE